MEWIVRIVKSLIVCTGGRQPPAARCRGGTRSIGCCRITLIVSIYIISTLDRYLHWISTLDIYTICDVVMANCH